MLLPITGAAYTHPSQDTNYQRCINWYPTEVGPDGVGRETLMRTGGLELLSEALSGIEIRQIKYINGFYYVVCSQYVYRIEVNALTKEVTSTELLGTIVSTTGIVKIANNPTQIIFVDGTDAGYIYTPLTSGHITVGPIGGTALDTYNLIINNVGIYTAQDVSTALTPTALVTQINLFTASTNITAVNSDGTIYLTSNNSDQILIQESGTGFTTGTDGLTVNGSEFSTGTPGLGALTAFRAITDADFLGGSTVVFANGYFAYNEPASARIWSSDLNDGTAYDALDVLTAESSPDDLVGLAINKGEIWAFGEKSIEIFYNPVTPGDGSPFAPRKGLEINIGCAAMGSIVEFDDLVMWLDHRRFIVQSNISAYMRDNNSGYALNIVSTFAINTEIAQYEVVSDAIATSYVYQGQLMYQISFPTVMKTWVYVHPLDPQTVGKWHERLYYNSGRGRFEHHLVQYCSSDNSIVVAGGIRSNKLYLMGKEYFDDAGELIHRIRNTSHYPTQFHNTGIDKLEVRMLSGMAPQDTNPQIMLRYSNDGGHTWSNEIARPIGKVGEYAKRITWNCLGSALEWLFEFRVAERMELAIIYAAVLNDEVEVD